MMKLNRINLKLHEFENKYIKSKNKSKDTGSTSDDSTSNFELSLKSNFNGVTNQKFDEKTPELEDEPAQTNVSDFEPQNLGKLTNGHAQEPTDEPKIFTRSNLKLKTANRSKVFNVMENIKLISLDDSAETDKEDIKKSSVESVSEAGISAKSDIKAKSELGKFSSNNFKSFSRKLSTVFASEAEISSSDDNKANGDIVEDLASPVSDVLEDITTDQTDGSLPPVQSDEGTAPKNISSEASSVSEMMNYNYSSEFERLSDASKTKKHNEPQTNNIKAVSKTQAEDKDATLANSSELDQSFVHAPESNGTESGQSNQARSSGKISENTSPSRSEFFSPIPSDHLVDSFREEEAATSQNIEDQKSKIENKSDSEDTFSEKILTAEQSERRERSRTDSKKSKSKSDEITSSDGAQDRKVREENDRVYRKKSLKVEKSKRKGSSRRSSEISKSSDNNIASSGVDTDWKVCEKDDRTGRNVPKSKSLKKRQKTEKTEHRDGSRPNSEKSKSSDNGITSHNTGTDREVFAENDRVKSNECVDKGQYRKAARGVRKHSDGEASFNEVISSDAAANFKIRGENDSEKISECVKKVQGVGRKSARGLRKNSDVSEVSDNEVTSPDAVTDRKIPDKFSRHKESEAPRSDGRSKVGERATPSKHRKSCLKASDSNSEKWNNCDSQSKNSILGSAVSRKLVDTGTITIIQGSARSKDKDTAEKQSRKTDSIRTIKNDISSEFGTKKENGPKENADSMSAKSPDNIHGSPKNISRNTKNVNTQTSPKVCFEENIKSGGEKCFEDNFETSPKNFCKCCPRHDRKPMDFIAFKSSDVNFETAMNHLLMGQLRFIQNMMEKQNQSHKLNRQIIQQMNLSKR